MTLEGARLLEPHSSVSVASGMYCCKLFVLLNFHINRTQIWRLDTLASREANDDMRSLADKLNLSRVMTFYLIPHMHKLVAIVENILV